ncbi:M15 family metallopeptidase [Allosalinactinospora lopnorensis]|uniref:M15 family metallopeptidase n=1 Tax=Allosalinactinospora lopnorensis TaxID=1352348 RepID=UPI000B201C00|nr:M15 family metallopeptidase [Allosalinactinospora lopnorensis]
MPFSLDSTRRSSRVPRSGILTVLTARPWTRRRVVQAVVFTVLVALFAVPGAQVAVAPVTAPASADDDLDTLKEQAEQAKEDLEEATEKYTEREEALEEAQEDLVSTLHELQQTELELSDMRGPLSQLASTLYQQPDGGTLALMTSGTLDQDLQVESHVVKMSDDQEALLEEANELREKQVDLTSDAQELQAQTQLEKVELQDDLKALRTQSKESTDKLTKELEDRGMDIDAYLAGVECDPSAGEAATGAPNGLLPSEALCELHESDHFLRADAAVDFLAMNEAYTERFGTQICLTSSYRDLPNQHRVYAEQPPGNAAVPGTSNHGDGLAVDMCGGVQNYRSEQWTWLEQNGGEYGWSHPDWAKSSPFEPWHWEYKYAQR